MTKTLTTLRKEITLDTASEVKQIAKLLAKIAKHNPEALKAIFPERWLKEGKGDQMVEFYADQADYIANLFDLN